MDASAHQGLDAVHDPREHPVLLEVLVAVDAAEVAVLVREEHQAERVVCPEGVLVKIASAAELVAVGRHEGAIEEEVVGEVAGRTRPVA